MKIKCDGFEFNFTDALNAFIFDEKDKNNPHYHNLSHAMVDIIVELQEYYLFVEVKDFPDPKIYNDHEHFNHLRESLKYKYRDSWLYRWCEDKTEKPIKYLCLLELEKGLLTRMTKELRKQIPISIAGARWCKEISDGCAVLNIEIWNQRFTAWPVTRLPKV